MDWMLFAVFAALACLLTVGSILIYSFIIIWHIFKELEENEDEYF